MAEIREPKILSVRKAVWLYWKSDKFSWLILLFSILSVFVLIELIGDYYPVGPYYILSLIVLRIFQVYKRVRRSFWMQFAEANGWDYIGKANPKKESGIMFKQGHGRKIYNQITGVVNGREFRMFDYRFYVGYGRYRKTYNHLVFSFKFDGSFPHFYLNDKKNSYSIKAGKILSLPSEFQKKFELSVPDEYEIEALEIFTPDVLSAILDGDFKADIEFVNGEILIFFDGRVDYFYVLKSKFERALKLEDLLDEKLDRVKFTPIGDKPYTL